MELQELLSSKVFLKENSLINFESPAKYVNPFIDKVSKLTDRFNVEVSGRVANANESDNTENVAYGRYKIEALLPEAYRVEESDAVIGLIVALDSAKPVMKVYSGKNVIACLNLTIFNANNVFAQEMTGNVTSLYGKVGEYTDKVIQDNDDYIATVRKLKSEIYSGSTRLEMMGRLMDRSMENPKLGHTVIVQGYKELKNNKSVYYAKGGETTAWNWYNSITEYIKNADILDRSSKTVALSEIFLN